MLDRFSAIDMLKVSLKGIVDLFDDTELEQAVVTAGMDTGWQLPVGSTFRMYWYMERAKRACIAMLCFQTGHKFKFKQINLQQRFEHYMMLLKNMDAAYAIAKAERPEEFIDALTELPGSEKINRFGTYHAAGFQYTPVGKAL